MRYEFITGTQPLEAETAGQLWGNLWEHEEFYALRERMSRTLAQDERIRLAEQVDRIIAEEAPIVPISHLRTAVLIKDRVKGFPLSVSTPFDLRNVRVS